MRDVTVKLWMKVVALRKPLVLVALLVFGIIVIYELSKSWQVANAGWGTGLYLYKLWLCV